MKTDQFFNQSVEDLLEQFGVNAQTGLSEAEVKKRLSEYGNNRLETKKQKSLLSMFLEQFKSSMVIILLIAAIVSGVIGVVEGEGLMETFVILGILVINAVIGTVQEKKAQASLDALNKMSSPRTKVLRDGQVFQTDSSEIVPGDIVILETGDIVPADMRLMDAVNLKIQESSLTGESVPVEKTAVVLEGTDIPLGDRDNMAFSTGIVTYGRGKGLVTATGMQTQVGKIAHMLQNTEDTETPMGKRLRQLGKILGYIALGICAVIFLVGLLYGNNWFDMFMMAVSLAVAAIPEGLQIVSTIVLAIGVQRLVKFNAIVRTLPSVETLGSTTVICSDKTGTLTQNKMTVTEGWAGGNRVDFRDFSILREIKAESGPEAAAGPDIATGPDIAAGPDLGTLLLSSLLCTDAHLKMLDDGTHQTSGDPTETAIVDVALGMDMNKNRIDEQFPRRGEVPFDSDRKRMSVINRMKSGTFRIHVKGGLDEVLSVCTHILVRGVVRPVSQEDIRAIEEENSRMAGAALRVLAVAYRDIEQIPDIVDDVSVEKDLVFVGLLGMIDPARPEVIEAVKKCKTAGIRPVMITGDHKVTAMAIAGDIGIYVEGDKAITGSELEDIPDEELYRDVRDYSVYARVAPEHKVRIVQAWRSQGDIVAMTGDGVNDAPALKQADIGVSMGIVGTEVAKEASDIILTDDNFATIVGAVQEGRRIYDNILKAIQFLLSANVGEVLLIFIASVFNLGNPLSPILILWINLVTDSLPALALSMDPAENDIMTRKPRDPGQGIFTRGMIRRISYQGATIGLISLAAYLVGYRDGGNALGQTMAFAVLGFSQLFHVRNLHSNIHSSFRTGLLSNKALLGAILVSCLLLLAVLVVPGMMKVFGTVSMDTIHWLITMGLSLVPIVVVELMKWMKINHSKDEF